MLSLNGMIFYQTHVHKCAPCGWKRLRSRRNQKRQNQTSPKVYHKHQTNYDIGFKLKSTKENSKTLQVPVTDMMRQKFLHND